MDTNNISNLIKTIRKENNLTQKDLASILGVTYQAVSKWETGKSIPDIEILKDISKRYNIDINDLLKGNNIKKKKKKLYLIIIPIIIILIVLIILIFNKNKDFEFRRISTTCDNFKLSGVAAYNKNKTAISINDITFCGDKDDEEYDTISCNLYEENKGKKRLISKCKKDKNKTIEDYLKEVNIKVDNYNSICHNITNSNIYIELNTTKSNKENIYKIPLKIDNNCKK